MAPLVCQKIVSPLGVTLSLSLSLLQDYAPTMQGNHRLTHIYKSAIVAAGLNTLQSWLPFASLHSSPGCSWH